MRKQTDLQNQQEFKSFTTRNIPAHERIDYWEAHNSDALIGYDIRTLNEQALSAEQRNRLFPRLRAAKVLGSSQIVERTPSMVRQHPTEAVALFFCLQGDSFFFNEHGTEVLRPGQVLACKADSTFIRGFGEGVSEMVLTVHMEDFIRLSGGESLTRPQKFAFSLSPGAQPARTAAHRLAYWIDNALNNTTAPANTIQDDCMSWLEMLFKGAGTDSVQMYETAHQFMDIHLGNPGLRRTDIAHRLGVSERQVTRLFSANNTSFSRQLTIKRVAAARSLLATEHQTTISDIARRCGFRSMSHFSRTFREITGYSPSDVRENPLLNIELAEDSNPQ